MSRRNFAKKLVAYSMAFAVAFSTITVSPVFVKEAKAATVVDITKTTTTNNAIGDKVTILESVESTKTSGSAVTLDIVKEKLGLTTMINPGLAVAKDDDGDTAKVGTMTIGNAIANDPATGDIDESEGSTYLKDAATVISSTANNKPVIFNGTDSTTLNGNKDIELTPATGTVTGTASYTWYKISPATNSFELTTGTGATATTETVTVKYYVVEQLHQSTNHDIALATADSLGYYLNVKKGSGSGVDYKLWNLYETSTLTATSERTEFKVNAGDNAKLVVNATSNKSTLTYKWKFGTKVLPDTTNICTVENVDATKLGYYSCEVSDGVKTKTVSNIKLSLNTYGVAPVPSYKNVVKVLDADNYLVNDTATFTSVVPKQDDYMYVWTVNKGGLLDNRTIMSESDIQKYDAANNTFTVTKEDTDFSGATVKCEVFYKNDYLSASTTIGPKTVTMADMLKVYSKATTDITKYEAKKDIINFEQYINPAKVVYTEEFTLLPVTNEDTTSENIVKNVNDGLSISVPAVVGREKVDPTNSKGGNTVGIVTKTLTLPNGDTKNVFAYSLNNLNASDFGAYRFVVTETYTEYKTIANAATAADSGYTLYDFTLGTDITNIPSTYANVGAYRTANSSNVVVQKKAVTKTSTKTFNIVYNPDLTVSASDVSAKIGEDITLSVNATSKLPLNVVWDSKNNFQTLTNDSKDILKTKEFTVKSGDIYVPAQYDSEGKLKANTDINYVDCVVKNGIETKVVKICVNKVGGFVVRNSVGVAQTVDFTEPVKSLADREVTLKTDVTANEGSNVTYAWYKNTVAGTPLATTADYTLLFKGTSSTETYKCVVADKDTTEKITITYTITKETAGTTGTIAYAPEKYVYTYTGEAIRPVVVTYNGAVLTEGTDYDITYIDNVDAGVAFYEITFKGDFAELKAITKEDVAKNNKDFTIVKADNKVVLADTTVALGQAVLPTVTTNLGKAALTYTYYADAACTTEIAVPTKAGTYYVKATAAATANYKETESNVATIVVKALGTTSSLAVTARTSTTMTVKYAKVDGAAGYRIYVKNVKTNYAWKVVKETTALTYKVTGLPAGYNTAVAVRAYDANKVLAPKYASVTKRTAPGTTSKVTITTSKNAAKLTWNKVTGATHYRVYVKKAGKWTALTTTKSNTFTKTGLKRRTTYTFAVKAYNSTDKLWADKYVAKSAKTK